MRTGRLTLTTIGVLTAAGLTAGVVPAAPAPVPTAHDPAVQAAARLTALEQQADAAGLAAQQADEALLQDRDPAAAAAAQRAEQTLVSLATRQEPQLQAVAQVIGVEAVAAGGAVEPTAVTAALTASSRAAKAVTFARSQLGKPYRYAGAGLGAYDCSGLTMRAYSSVRIGIGGHGSTAQWNRAKAEHRLVSYGRARPGDLIFYGSPGAVYHVAIYSGNGRMIEAPYPGKRVREVAVRSAGRLAQVARPA